MRVLSTLFIRDHRAKVGLQKQALMVSSGATKTRVPLESLDAVVMFGRAQVTSDAIAACVERGVRLSSLRRNGKLRFVVGGPVRGNVHLRLAQTRAATDPDQVAALARWFVAGKLQNYRRLLIRWSWDADPGVRSHLRRQEDAIAARLDSLAGATNGDRIRGIEGDATRRYFKGLAAHLESTHTGLFFTGRNRRPPRDPVNALLSMTYGLVLTDWSAPSTRLGSTHRSGSCTVFALAGQPSPLTSWRSSGPPSLIVLLSVSSGGARFVASTSFSPLAVGVTSPMKGGAPWSGPTRRSRTRRFPTSFWHGACRGGLSPHCKRPSLLGICVATSRRTHRSSWQRDGRRRDLRHRHNHAQGERRLTRVARICEGFGVRAQFSVFECRLGPVAHARLLARLEDEINPITDSVNLYRFAGTVQEARISLGRRKSHELGDPWLL